jgi:4-amino-4-deoxy-L-arabinose transferase-like glycosyltransferase
MSNRRLAYAAVAVIAVVALLPFLGLTDFTTKGEPREAVVALSMLNDGNWILPVNNGGDIPYKPPFFHFCIALLGLLTGRVGEYASRLPSALSLIAMTVGFYAFYVRRRSIRTALMATLFMFTAFEVHRAATVCRVDMMLTAFVVGALLLLYRWQERGGRGVPVWAVLCMSGAVLTKGPVGCVLPCMVMGVFMLLRGKSFCSTALRLIGCALLSCVLPAVWYVAAWQQGGDEFLSLVYEENIGRMTGTMSYDSHVHPFTYNFTSMLSGWAPWTLLLLLSLFFLPWRKLFSAASCASCCTWLAATLRRWLTALGTMDALRLFTWLSVVLIFVFYCLPSSKRSVYLLPCYPFMAMLMAEYVGWLWSTHRCRPIIWFVRTVCFISVVLTVAFVAIRCGIVGADIFHGSHAADNAAMLQALATLRLTPFNVMLIALPLLTGVFAAWTMRRKRLRHEVLFMVSALFVPVVTLQMALDGVYQPAVMNCKSLRPFAETISQKFPGQPLYSYISSPMMHFFGANFYLDNTIGLFEHTAAAANATANSATTGPVSTPPRGLLLIPTTDFPAFSRRHPDYRFRLVYTSPNRYATELHTAIGVYRFERK